MQTWQGRSNRGEQVGSTEQAYTEAWETTGGNRHGVEGSPERAAGMDGCIQPHLGWPIGPEIVHSHRTESCPSPCSLALCRQSPRGCCGAMWRWVLGYRRVGGRSGWQRASAEQTMVCTHPLLPSPSSAAHFDLNTTQRPRSALCHKCSMYPLPLFWISSSVGLQLQLTNAALKPDLVHPGPVFVALCRPPIGTVQAPIARLLAPSPPVPAAWLHQM